MTKIEKLDDRIAVVERELQQPRERKQNLQIAAKLRTAFRRFVNDDDLRFSPS